MSKMRRDNKIWCFFDKVDVNSRLARCHSCGRKISYKTTISNLKAHLKYKHPLALQELELKKSVQEKVSFKTERLFIEEDLNDSDQESDVWNYFEPESGDRVRCVVCSATRANDLEELKSHLAEKHPKLINGTSQDTLITDVTADEDGTYTEVIYLEEDTKKKTPKYYHKEAKSKPEIKNTKRKEKERRDSVSSDDAPIKRRKEEAPNELDTFLTYIKCLLRQVPSEMFTKLQLDIVNLIMKAKLSRNTINESALMDSPGNASREINIQRADVISVALADADIASVTESANCYNDAKND